MSTIRFFNGSRPVGKNSYAAQMARSRIMKGGKVSAAERFKAITQEKLEENRQKAMSRLKPFSLPGAKITTRKMSKHAEQILKMMAEKKALKRAKAERKRVVVQPRTFHNGKIIKNGRIYDIVGNTIGQVDTKNGKMSLAGFGGSLGKYKPGSIRTNMVIQDAISKYSPYYINLRKMQEMQQGQGVWGTPTDVINIYGRGATASASEEHSFLSNGDTGVYGYNSFDQAGPRQNVGSTAWGAMSDNVWGTYTDNIWGTSTDTVWGTNTSDVWGGIGGNPWGNHAKTVQIWGTGNGHNYLAALAAKVSLFFGLHLPSLSGRSASHEAAMARGGGGHHEQFTRAAGHDAHEHLQATRAAAQGAHHEAHHDAHEHVTLTRAILNFFK